MTDAYQSDAVALDGYPEEADFSEQRLTARDLLTLLRSTPDKPDSHVYLLQGTDRRLTIHAQQVRALNLIYALSVEGVLKSNSKVAVVGGGFAGVMSALAAAYLGADVTLFERKPTLLHLQAGSYTRWV